MNRGLNLAFKGELGVIQFSLRKIPPASTKIFDGLGLSVL